MCIYVLRVCVSVGESRADALKSSCSQSNSYDICRCVSRACNVPTIPPHVPCYYHPCGHHVPQHVTAVQYSILVPQKLPKTLCKTGYLGKPLKRIA